jgi:multiple sugar transport system substrate-binding protein
MSNKIMLTVVTQANGDGLKALIGKAEKFEAESEGIEVRIEQANGNFEVLNRMQRGEPGDLIHLSESVFAPYLRQGYIMDIMPFLQEDPSLSTEDFYRGALEGPSYEGKLAALPIDIHVPLIYYRKKSFEEAGIPEPTNDWTFEQFAETALRLTKGDQFGFRIDVDIELFEPFVKRSGGAYLSPDGSTAKGYADSEATAASLQRIVDWFRVQRITPLHGGEGCFSEKFAMVYNFTWWLPHVLQQHEGEYGVVGLPRAEEDQEDTNMMYMGGYGISTACKHPEEAWRLLKELSVPETGNPLSLLPATKPIARRQGKTEQPHWQCVLAELDKATKSSFYLSQTWNANRQIMNQDLMSWIKDGADIKASLKKWVDLIG